MRYNKSMDRFEIKKLRESLKLSQTEFGIKISELLGIKRAINKNTVYRWESGKFPPRDYFMKVLEQLRDTTKLPAK